MIRIPEPEQFESKGWITHTWTDPKGLDVTVLQREPFRFWWGATRLVTYVFLIPRGISNYQEILNDYPSLRNFAGKHKKSALPFAFQCGYALLPVYLAEGVPPHLINEVNERFKKRWCVLHVPSLLDTKTGRLYTRESQSFWGCIYSDYIRATLGDVTNLLHEGHSA